MPPPSASDSGANEPLLVGIDPAPSKPTVVVIGRSADAAEVVERAPRDGLVVTAVDVAPVRGARVAAVAVRGRWRRR